MLRNFALPNMSSMSSDLGIGYGSGIVITLSFLQSTQNLIDPSFLGTITTGDA